MKEISTYPWNLKIAIYFAFFGGILIIILETMRRYHQMLELKYFPAWFDDYIAGGLLIFGALKAAKSLTSGLKFLTAGWGFATGMMYASFFIQLANLDLPDPSSLPTPTVVLIKGILFTGCIVNFILSLLTLKKKDQLDPHVT